MIPRATRRAALGLVAALPAVAQTRLWPSRSIRCIVPSAAGGYDTYARFMAPRLAELLGQPVVVDNKPGANGNIGMQELQRSPPDGHTIMFGHIGAITINTAITTARRFTQRSPASHRRSVAMLSPSR